jgi:hypothetical protein
VEGFGKSYKFGTDYRHFEGSKAIPRLCLSKGCLYKCAFCDVQPHRATQPLPKEQIDQQVESITKLRSKLVYLDDKTFGQVSNYKLLPQLFNKLRKEIPGFQGFIVQTTGSDMNLKKFPKEFLRKSGIRFVELGVESFNDPILRAWNKPATEQKLQEAVDWLRENNIAFIPNIIVGGTWTEEMAKQAMKIPKVREQAGVLRELEETDKTYQRTMDFLERNKDIISHLNVYNLAVYADTELGKAIKDVKVEDLNENVVKKSFHKHPDVHIKWHKKFVDFANQRLEEQPIYEHGFMFASYNKEPNLTVDQAYELSQSKEAKEYRQLVDDITDKYIESKTLTGFGVSDEWGNEPAFVNIFRNATKDNLNKAAEEVRQTLNDQDSVIWFAIDFKANDTLHYIGIPEGIEPKEFVKIMDEAGLKVDRIIYEIPQSVLDELGVELIGSNKVVLIGDRGSKLDPALIQEFANEQKTESDSRRGVFHDVRRGAGEVGEGKIERRDVGEGKGQKARPEKVGHIPRKRAGPQRRKYEVDPEFLRNILSANEKVEGDLPKYARSINLERQDIEEREKRFEEEIGNLEPKSKQTWDETGEIRDEILGDILKVNKLLKKAKRRETLSAAEIDALRQLNVKAINSLKEIAESGAPKDVFDDALQRYIDNIFMPLSDASSEIGRALNIHKRYVSMARLSKALAEMERGMNERELEAFKRLDFENAYDVARFAESLGDPRFRDYFYEFWYNSILSGIPTHLVNVISNTAWSLWQIPHRALSGAVDALIVKFTGKERTRFTNEIVPLLAGYKKGFGEGARAALKVLKTGQENEWIRSQFLHIFISAEK